MKNYLIPTPELWWKDGFFWRHPSSGDAGDLIFNTLARIIDMNDKSEWAKCSLLECMDLLLVDKRWPDRLNQENTAKNRLQWWFGKGYTRPQDDMTRDPYVAFYCCALFLGFSNWIEMVPIPWYCFSPGVSWWRHKLMRPRKKPWWRWRLDHYQYLALAIKTSDDPNIISNKDENETRKDNNISI